MIGFTNTNQIKLTIYEKSEIVADVEDFIEVQKIECAFNSPEITSDSCKINYKYDIWYLILCRCL